MAAAIIVLDRLYCANSFPFLMINSLHYNREGLQ